MMATPFVSQEEFNLFHNIDTELYRTLVLTLGREPAQSMQVIALFLWLERIGYRNAVKKILSLPVGLINEVADEAVACLSVIINPMLGNASFSDGSDIPLLQNLLDKPISLSFFQENHVAAARGVTATGQDVCVRALSDIMQIAVARNTPEVAMAENQMGFTGTQVLFGSVGPVREIEVPVDNRTMFVTFSKGYPVSDKELKEFLTKICGQADCIEALHMQEVQPHEQSLFSRVVFHHASTIDKILRGEVKVKFSINGKHVWARKFVPKRKDLLQPPPPPPPPPPPHFMNPLPVGEFSGSGRHVM